MRKWLPAILGFSLACSKSSAPDTLVDPGGSITSPSATPSSSSLSTVVSSAIAPVLAPSAITPADAKPVRFVAVGDTGKGNDDARRVARAIAHKCAKDGCDFVILLGDNVYESGISSPDDPAIREKFENVFSPVPVDFYPVLGNHDYGHNGLGTDFAKGDNEIAYTKRSKKWKMPSAYYARSLGVVDMFALDTNMAMFDRVDPQAKEMGEALAKSRAPWKVAYGHHPYRSNGPHGNAGHYNGFSAPAEISGAYVKHFLEEVVCGKADVYFAGHDHSMQWIVEPCDHTELLVGGAGAETTTLSEHNPTWFQSTSLGFLYVTVTVDTFAVDFISDREKPLFSRTIEKKK